MAIKAGIDVQLDAFLLAKTECTQAQWQAVMGTNPAYFTGAGADAPVEQVSWLDMQVFLERTGLSLPSEAQWEYAARAGSEQALPTGPLVILGKNNGPALDPIGWYAGNSGVAYAGADDSSGWSEVQAPHALAGTHPVGGKAANAFGLFDMLGNVWEACADGWHDSLAGQPTDGSPRPVAAPGDQRVARGGGYGNDARLCRAASRLALRPDLAIKAVGFRAAYPLR